MRFDCGGALSFGRLIGLLRARCDFEGTLLIVDVRFVLYCLVELCVMDWWICG
jgi:hypothetical protein